MKGLKLVLVLGLTGWGTVGWAQTRFAVIGDYGTDGAEEARVAEQVRKARVEFVVTTGDNTYVGSAIAGWDRAVGQYYATFMKLPAGSKYADRSGKVVNFFPVLGNHDWPAEPYLAYFDLPESTSGNKRYYSFRRGPVEFFMLSSDRHEPDGTKAGSKQYRWAKGAVRASTAPWQVVVFHHPAYTYPSLNPPAVNMRWEFRAWGADLLLAGHNHNMQAMTVKGGANDGLPAVVQGAGGYKLYRINRDRPIDGADGVFANDTSFGFSVGEATEDRLSLTFLDADGETLHRMSVKKNAPAAETDF